MTKLQKIAVILFGLIITAGGEIIGWDYPKSLLLFNFIMGAGICLILVEPEVDKHESPAKAVHGDDSGAGQVEVARNPSAPGPYHPVDPEPPVPKKIKDFKIVLHDNSTMTIKTLGMEVFYPGDRDAGLFYRYYGEDGTTVLIVREELVKLTYADDETLVIEGLVDMPARRIR